MDQRSLVSKYREHQKKMQALQQEQEALLKQAMKIMQEDRMDVARHKLEAMLGK